MNALVQSNQEVYRSSTDAAGLCRDIVLKTAKNIQGRKYVCVEGWQAIAIAHGCTASADAVERVNDEGMGGFKATGIVRRMSDGQEIARAEGFIGDDEKMWASRPVYARRAMVQTRAISRACRSAFAHVVVMIDAGLSTTPAEEVPNDGFDNAVVTGDLADANPRNVTPKPEKVKDAPFPQGPAKNITELRAIGREMWRDIEAAEDGVHLDSLIATNAALFSQLERALPSWIHGGQDKQGQTFEGLQAVIVRLRFEFDQISAAQKLDTVRAG